MVAAAEARSSFSPHEFEGSSRGVKWRKIRWGGTHVDYYAEGALELTLIEEGSLRRHILVRNTKLRATP
jgi:hypothetical protein